MRYELAIHSPSGEWYALIRDDNDNITDLCGPLSQLERTGTSGSPSSLYDFHYSAEDAQWANDQQWRTICTYVPAVFAGVSRRRSYVLRES